MTAQIDLDAQNVVEEMEKICRLGSFLRSCNVLPVSFKNGETIDVFIALTPEQRSQGLAGFSSLSADGMLFCYETPSYAPYTMQDMLFDLDIAFFSSDGTLISWSTEKAGSIAPVTCSQQYNYVLECPAGTFVQSSLVVRGK